jgi:hypothetical protein
MSNIQQTSQNDSVEVILPDFRLQNKLGGAADKLLNPAAVKRAAAALASVVPPLADEVTRLVHELNAAVLQPKQNARDLIWSNAHEIRGLAGTAGMKSLGITANLICRYLNGTGSDFKADPKVLSTIAVVALQALKKGADEDAMVRTLINDSAQAVTVQLKREGRSE